MLGREQSARATATRESLERVGCADIAAHPVVGRNLRPTIEPVAEVKVTAGDDVGGHGLDPEGTEQAKLVLNDVEYCKNAYEAMDGADALAIVTEWDAFRALDLNRAKSLLTQPVFVDLRNIYPRDTVEKAGFTYTAVGR